MPKIDLEDYLDAILLTMTSKLNTRIAAIEAEKVAQSKGLDPTLAPIESYYRQSWSNQILNNAISIFYGIEDVTAVSGGPATAELVKFFCEVIMIDSGMQADTDQRILRYARALKEIFDESFDSVPSGFTKIETVRPISFKLSLDSSDEVKIGGVSLQAALV